MLKQQWTNVMSGENLTKPVFVELSIGHLLLLWEVFANNFKTQQLVESLSVEEKRAIWAFEDLCERSLVENGIGPQPQAELDKLLNVAREHCMTIPVECLD